MHGVVRVPSTPFFLVANIIMVVIILLHLVLMEVVLIVDDFDHFLLFGKIVTFIGLLLIAMPCFVEILMINAVIVIHAIINKIWLS